MFNVPRIDWCSLTSKGKNTNLWMMRAVVNGFRNTFPSIVQECPYEGRYELSKKGALNKDFMRILPIGVFRSDIRFQMDDENKVVATSMQTLSESLP